ncbi:hypothetical protein D9619_003984 [Psilocybe cf. subviscida]|uniref:F-box domain-containing protein n=1 Tax=Psilocybe cf. subviscida TaxID=2480587 RepID=A0A8H5BQH5_9AGAR|nr:hypothetical protein D9619_003984 [Psilocybe cf. subviscida]
MNYHISTFSFSELTDSSEVIFPTTEFSPLNHHKSVKQWLWSKTRRNAIAFLSPAWEYALSKWKENADVFRNLCEEGQTLTHKVLWKHHFIPIDTSNALLWLNTPANLALPSHPFVNGLPDEILVRIFAFVVHSDCTTPQDRVTKRVRYGITSGSSPTPPWLLGHICSRWLQLVSTHPILWSTIAVCSPNEKHLAQAVFWLERSKKCPLNVSVEQYVTPNPMCNAILHLLVAQAHRWRKVHFVLVDEAPFKRLQPGDVPLLEEFRVRARRVKASRLGRIFQVFHSSKALKHANWGDSYSPSMVAHTPWTLLTNITFHYIDISMAVVDALATCCDTLASLQLYNVRWVEDVVPPIVMPRLEHLVCDYVQGGAHVFDALTLPNLARLELAAHNLVPWKPLTQSCVFSSAVAMMERSGCALKMFETRSSSLPRVFALHRETTVFDQVEALAVYGYLQDASSLRQMAESKMIFPSLRHLTLENVETPDGLLADVVLSREHELHSVSVCLPDQHHRMDRAALCWIKKEGMTVAVLPFLSNWQELGVRAEVACRMFTDTPTLHFPEYERHWVL